ncbi:MAG: hypothetical protein QOI03_395 [Solirubrobacteraceae bacterium]|nr:hypothetical protein [Solirubrobacteraceae bacterium]
MPAIAMKSEYGPTLGRLLAPRWHGASALVRGAITALGVLVLAAVIAAVLTLENAHFSHGGRVPFSFSYRGLWRTAAQPGEFVRLARRHADGTLADSFAVGPLSLPPYSGSLSAELPLYAAGYIRGLRGRYQGFSLRGEGKTKVNGMISAYDVFYAVPVEGRTLYGRDIMLLPERPGAREGVEISMLSTPGKSPGFRSAIEVALTGELLRPLKTFSFG